MRVSWLPPGTRNTWGWAEGHVSYLSPLSSLSFGTMTLMSESTKGSQVKVILSPGIYSRALIRTCEAVQSFQRLWNKGTDICNLSALGCLPFLGTLNYGYVILAGKPPS